MVLNRSLEILNRGGTNMGGTKGTPKAAEGGRKKQQCVHDARMMDYRSAFTRDRSQS